MTDRPKTSVDLRWEGGQKFTSTDSYGHTLTVNAPARDPCTRRKKRRCSRRSRGGAISIPVNQLRDPAIFEEDGRVYLLYSVAGERGIGLAEVHVDQ